MGQDRIRQEWPRITGRLRRHWPQLTSADLNVPDGSVEYLAALLQRRYGMDRREAFLQVYEFECEV